MVEQAIEVWNRARIPTCRKDHAIEKLEQLFKEWTSLKKSKNRKSELQKGKENEFCENIANLLILLTQTL